MHCPICKKTADVKFRPFCSKRCADVDLHGWLTEGYAIPAEDAPDEEELEALISELEQQDSPHH